MGLHDLYSQKTLPHRQRRQICFVRGELILWVRGGGRGSQPPRKGFQTLFTHNVVYVKIQTCSLCQTKNMTAVERGVHRQVCNKKKKKKKKNCFIGQTGEKCQSGAHFCITEEH